MITYQFRYKNNPRVLHKLHTGEEQAKEFYHQYYSVGDEVEVTREDDSVSVYSQDYRRRMLWD